MMFKRKGGGVKGLLNNVKKKLHFSLVMASLTANPQVGDGTDGKLVHLDGLNFSRAWGLYRIADRLGGEEEERFSRFTKSLVISSSLDFGL